MDLGKMHGFMRMYWVGSDEHDDGCGSNDKPIQILVSFPFFLSKSKNSLKCMCSQSHAQAQRQALACTYSGAQHTRAIVDLCKRCDCPECVFLSMRLVASLSSHAHVLICTHTSAYLFAFVSACLAHHPHRRPRRSWSGPQGPSRPSSSPSTSMISTSWMDGTPMATPASCGPWSASMIRCVPPLSCHKLVWCVGRRSRWAACTSSMCHSIPTKMWLFMVILKTTIKSSLVIHVHFIEPWWMFGLVLSYRALPVFIVLCMPISLTKSLGFSV